MEFHFVPEAVVGVRPKSGLCKPPRRGRLGHSARGALRLSAIPRNGTASFLTDSTLKGVADPCHALMLEKTIFITGVTVFQLPVESVGIALSDAYPDADTIHVPRNVVV